MGEASKRPSRRVSTNYLRVPADDWSAVTTGNKSEFRVSPYAVSKALWTAKPPTVVVAYRKRWHTGYDFALMALEAKWNEPLGAISPESLEREGFSSFAEFRRYWMFREKKRFTPTRIVTVFRVRLWREGDEREFADRLFQRLYGPFLPGYVEEDDDEDEIGET